MKKRLFGIICVVVLIALLSRVSVLKISDKTMVLFKYPGVSLGGSAGADVFADMELRGIHRDNVKRIEYVGSDSKLKYFRCVYQSEEGQKTCYIYDDNDDYSGRRATVIWE